MLGYITFIILSYNYIAGSGVEDFDQRFIAVVKNCLVFLCFITFLTFIFGAHIYICYKARRKQLVLEDGIENEIDSPTKHRVEESPPPYQEARKIERKATFSNAKVSIIL